MVEVPQQRQAFIPLEPITGSQAHAIALVLVFDAESEKLLRMKSKAVAAARMHTQQQQWCHLTNCVSKRTRKCALSFTSMMASTILTTIRTRWTHLKQENDYVFP